MRSHPLLIAVAVATGTLVAAGGAVGAEGAPPTDPATEAPVDTTAPPAPAATSTLTVPLLGAPLVVNLTTDAGGGLLDVALDPADGMTATSLRSNKVGFVNDDGTVKVRVSTRHGGESVAVRAGGLGDISGPGAWSGDVFGTGETTTVGYTVGATADGGPDITGVSVESTLDATVGETAYRTKDHHGTTAQSASVAITFTAAGQTRLLWIRAAAGEHDGTATASLKVGLSRVQGRQQAEGPAVGPHTWSGQLCDGTVATISYTVAEDGSITDVVATPDATAGDGRRGGTVVTFATGERVSIAAKGEGDEMTVGAKVRVRCERTDPSVNTPIADDATMGDGHRPGDGDHHRRGDDQGDDQGEDRRGDHRDDDRRDGDRWDDGRRGGDHRDDGDGSRTGDGSAEGWRGESDHHHGDGRHGDAPSDD